MAKALDQVLAAAIQQKTLGAETFGARIRVLQLDGIEEFGNL